MTLLCISEGWCDGGGVMVVVEGVGWAVAEAVVCGRGGGTTVVSRALEEVLRDAH